MPPHPFSTSALPSTITHDLFEVTLDSDRVREPSRAGTWTRVVGRVREIENHWTTRSHSIDEWERPRITSHFMNETDRNSKENELMSKIWETRVDQRGTCTKSEVWVIQFVCVVIVSWDCCCPKICLCCFLRFFCFYRLWLPKCCTIICRKLTHKLLLLLEVRK